MNKVTARLRKLTKRFMAENDLATPSLINHGECFAWADEALIELTPGAVKLWADEQPDHVDGMFGHCFVLYKGLYYDAECHTGVKDWKQLPAFVIHPPGCGMQPCCNETLRIRREKKTCPSKK